VHVIYVQTIVIELLFSVCLDTLEETQSHQGMSH